RSSPTRSSVEMRRDSQYQIRGLGAFVCDGIARETVEGRGAVSGSLAGMFPARRRALVSKVRSGRTAHPICPWKSTLSTTILLRGPFVGGLDHFGERQALVEQRVPVLKIRHDVEIVGWGYPRDESIAFQFAEHTIERGVNALAPGTVLPDRMGTLAVDAPLRRHQAAHDPHEFL